MFSIITYSNIYMFCIQAILYTLLQENVILPHPQPGRPVAVPLSKEDLLLHNILNVVSVDPHRLIMLYKFGYEMPGIYNQVRSTLT